MPLPVFVGGANIQQDCAIRRAIFFDTLMDVRAFQDVYKRQVLRMYQTNVYTDFLHHELVSGSCLEQHAHPDSAL